MKTQKLKQNAVSFLVELIFNKWSLLFVLYAVSALIIGQEGVATAKTVSWTPAELNVQHEAFRATKEVSGGVVREVTAYNSLESQTDSTPCEGAYGNVCEPYKQGKCVVASNAYLKHTKLWIQNIGECEVLDRMNRRFTNRIDIFMGDDLERALKFGKQKLQVVEI